MAFVRTEVGRDGVAVLTRDFNAPFSDEVRRLTGLATSYEPRVALIDAWEYRRPLDPGWTWMRANELAAIHREPEARIDYIFVTPSSNGGRGEVLGVELIGARPVQGLWPSDHAGVVVALRW